MTTGVEMGARAHADAERDEHRMRPVACPLCGADDARLLYQDRNRRERLPVVSSYVRCRRCDLIYLNPVVERPERLYAAVYGREAGSLGPSEGRWARRYEALLARCESLFDGSSRLHNAECDAPAGKILDVGCGDGARLAPYHRAGWTVYGVDVESAVIRDAKKRGFGTFLAGELREHAFPAGAFDVVRMDNALEHVREPRGVIREIRRILKPGGRFYLYVPNGEGLTMRLMGRYSINSWIPFHVVLFTPATIRRLLDEEGFEASIEFNTPLSWLALSCKQLVSRGPFIAQLGLWERTAALCLGPLAWLANGLARGEELVVRAVRRPA